MNLYRKKENYTITYKNLITGRNCIVEGEASNTSDARELFERNFEDYCQIIKIQTSKEWIEEKAEEIANDMMKYIKKDIGKLVIDTKKSLINPKEVKKIDYNSKAFKKGLKKINKEIEISKEMSAPNHEKMYLSYNL